MSRVLPSFVVCALSAAGWSAHAGTEARWINPVSGNWSDAAKWSTASNFPNNGTPAGTTYDAVIDAAGTTPYKITLNRTVALDSLTLNSSAATVSVSGQSMATNLLDLKAGTFDLLDGTLSGARVQSSGGTLRLDVNGRLDNVTLATVPVAKSFLVSSTLTLEDLTLRVAGLNLLGAATLAGTGRIVLEGGGSDGWIDGIGINIGAGITVETGDGLGGGAIGVAGGSVVNRGTILLNTSRALQIQGDLQNLGLIRLESGSLGLGGNLTIASLGRFERTGGELGISGRLDLQGGALDLNTTLGTVYLSGERDQNRATIANGTLRSSGEATVIPFYGVLENVTLDMDLTVRGSSGELRVPGLVMNGRRITVTSDGALIGGTIGGTGVIEMGTWVGNGGVRSRLWADFDTGLPLVIGPGITVRTGTVSSPQVGIVVEIVGANGDAGLRNEGMISVETPGSRVLINATRFGGSASNGWTNAGKIKLSAGELLLGGRFKLADLGDFERTGGTVRLLGTVDLTGRTLRFDRDNAWLFGDAQAFPGPDLPAIVNGRVETADGVNLAVSDDVRLLLDGVTLAAPLAVESGGLLRVGKRLTLDNAVITRTAGTGSGIGLSTGIEFSEPSLIDGVGEIRFDARTAIGTPGNVDAPVTFGPGVTIRPGRSGAEFTATSRSPITIQGKVVAGGMGRTMTFDGPVAITGKAVVEPDGSLSLSALTNLVAGTLTGGEFEIGARGSLRLPGPIRSNNATIHVDGPASVVFYGNSVANDALVTLERNEAKGILAVTGTRQLSLIGDLTNDGLLLLGGTVSMADAFVQSDGGRLRFEIAGVLPGTHGRLVADGEFAADGRLGVELVAGYVPAAGAQFDLLDFGSFSGGFDGYDLPALPNGLAWDTSSVPTTGVLTVVPEPAGVGIVAVLGAATLTRRRRRVG